MVCPARSNSGLVSHFPYTTGCPKVHDNFDTPLFLGLGGPITKSFDVVIAECGWFFLGITLIGSLSG